MSTELALVIYGGSEFQFLGPKQENALSANVTARVRGTTNCGDDVDDLVRYLGDGCSWSKSEMYCGAC